MKIKNRQAFYDKLLAEGMAPRLAEMLASQRAPASRTDREFLADAGTLGKQFGRDQFGLEKRVQIARSLGYNPSPNDVYVDALADFPGDPRAFVKPSAPKGDIKRQAQARNISLNGAVKHKASQRPPKPRVKLAPDIVRDIYREKVRQDPGVAFKDKREVVAEIVDKHAYK